MAVDVVERRPLWRRFNRSQCMDCPPGQKKEVVVRVGGRCGEVVVALGGTSLGSHSSGSASGVVDYQNT